MENKFTEVKTAIIAVFAFINLYVNTVFGVFTILLYIVIGLMIFDLFSRMYAAGRRTDEKVESKKIMDGIYKKIGLCMLIVLSLIVDLGFSEIAKYLNINIATKIIFTALVLAWLFVREVISIMENLQHAGIELPSFLVKALGIAKEQIDNIGDKAVGGNND